MSRFEVIVGNIGSVFTGEHEGNARRLFNSWRKLSINGQGRAAGEPVYLLMDDELVKEHDRSNDNGPERASD